MCFLPLAVHKTVQVNPFTTDIVDEVSPMRIGVDLLHQTTYIIFYDKNMPIISTCFWAGLISSLFLELDYEDRNLTRC